MITKEKKLLISLNLALTFSVFAPISLWLGNISEFWFSVLQIFPYLIVVFLILELILLLIMFGVKRRLELFFIALIFGVGTGLYLQGNWLNVSYGVLDGSVIDWSQYRSIGYANAVIWVACLAIPIVLVFCKRTVKYCIPVFSFLSFLMISMQSVGVISLLVGNWPITKQTMYLSSDNLTKLSSEKNIIIFIPDTFDAKMMNEALSVYPELEEMFNGYTYYNNASGMFPRTKAAMPHLLTGIPYDNSKPYSQYISEAYQDSDIINELKNQNFEINLYTMDSTVSSEAPVSNLVEGLPKIKDAYKLMKKEYQLVAYSYFPHMLKQFFWMYTGEFDDFKDDVSICAPWSMSNTNFENISNRLEFEIVPEKQYKVIHFNGTHPPFYTDEFGHTTATQVSAEQITKGVLKLISRWVEQLKRQDIYENTEIIILGDHGYYGMRQNPAVIYKTGGSEKLKVVDAPISYADLRPTILNAINSDIHQEKTIREYYAMEERVRQFRYFEWTNVWDEEYLPDIYEYNIGQYASLADEMQLTGVVYAQPLVKYSDLVDASVIQNAETSNMIRWDVRGNKIHYSYNMDFITMEAYALLADVDAKQTEVFISLADENGTCRVYKPEKTSVLDERDVNGKADNALYEYCGMVFVLPVDEISSKEYNIDIFIKDIGTGKVFQYPETRRIIFDNQTRVCRLVDNDIVLDTDVGTGGNVSIPLIKGNIVEEAFYSEVDVLQSVSLRTVTWDRIYSDEDYFLVEIYKESDGERVFEQKVKLSNVPNNAMYKIKTDNVTVKPDEWYRIRITSDAEDVPHSLSLMCGEAKSIEKSYMISNGKKESNDVCVYIQGRAEIILDTDVGAGGDVSIPLIKGNIIEEVFYSEIDILQSISLRTITWNRNYSEEDCFLVEIYKGSAEEKIFEQKVKTANVPDNAMYKIKTDNIAINPGEWYRIRITSETEDVSQSLSLMCREAKSMERSYMLLNGKKEDNDVCVYIQGKNVSENTVPDKEIAN